jgi:hypothetical protein
VEKGKGKRERAKGKGQKRAICASSMEANHGVEEMDNFKLKLLPPRNAKIWPISTLLEGSVQLKFTTMLPKSSVYEKRPLHYFHPPVYGL